ncbi:IDEAL domain-containing protein [Fervidibacillus halotolerans]|uniref:IDEAL domain-containing protein n=1 Tax=Fervidibacillus halotolerans TaxID=2980027 RepID=A0A9E8M2A6_9BACI|nr:IDEAL domain-containing protein [Fervidibacillus halotolerans]WAA13029.1 IDEAL domain-containing protein [Fervidibacillus halotolerans]
MNKERSYSELTKAYRTVQMQNKEKFVQTLYIDILLHESLLKEKREKIKREIDSSLDAKDKELFFTLVEQLKKLEAELNA